MSDDLPNGWSRIDDDGPYVKFVKRSVVEVPKRAAGDPFERDAVVIATEEIAGVTRGPGARQSWRVRYPESVAIRLAAVIEAWVQADGDPYGGSALDDQLEQVAMEDRTEQTQLLGADP